MILLVALLSDHLVMPAECLRDPTVALLLLDEDIEVFYGENRQRIRFQGLAAGDPSLRNLGGRGRGGGFPQNTKG